MQNDQLWKSILEDVFEDFLTFFYPETEQMFDFSSGFVYLDKELQQLFPPEKGKHSYRYVDKLVQVYTREGDEQWVLIHVEVQGTAEQDFERRMFRYYSRILDKYDRRIAAFAIFTDTNSDFHPRQYEYSFLGTEILYRFNSYKVLQQDMDSLRLNPNPFACVILAVKAAIEGKLYGDAVAFQFKKQLFLEFKARNLSEAKKQAILVFLKNYVRFEDNNFDDKFEEEVEQTTESTMGIVEYLLEQEREKTKAEREKRIRERERARAAEKALIEEQEKNKLIARNLKSSGVSIDIIAQATGLSIEDIENL